MVAKQKNVFSKNIIGKILIVLFCLSISIGIIIAPSEEEVKSLLKKVLLEHFNNPKNTSLDISETKDFLKFYLTTNSNNGTLNLSSAISENNRPIQNIYIKAITSLAEKEIDNNGNHYAIGKYRNNQTSKNNKTNETECTPKKICDSQDRHVLIMDCKSPLKVDVCTDNCINGTCIGEKVKPIDNINNCLINTTCVNGILTHINASCNKSIINCPNGCENNVCVSIGNNNNQNTGNGNTQTNTPTCYDSDGTEYNNKGYVSYSGQNFFDDCVQDPNKEIRLIEYICKNNTKEYISYKCPYKCSEGRCITGSKETTNNNVPSEALKGNCVNGSETSDPNDDRYYYSYGVKSSIEKSSFCDLDGRLRKFGCRNSTTWIENELVDCPYGCDKGVCVNSNVPCTYSYCTGKTFVKCNGGQRATTQCTYECGALVKMGSPSNTPGLGIDKIGDTSRGTDVDKIGCYDGPEFKFEGGNFEHTWDSDKGLYTNVGGFITTFGWKKAEDECRNNIAINEPEFPGVTSVSVIKECSSGSGFEEDDEFGNGGTCRYLICEGQCTSKNTCVLGQELTKWYITSNATFNQGSLPTN